MNRFNEKTLKMLFRYVAIFLILFFVDTILFRSFFQTTINRTFSPIMQRTYATGKVISSWFSPPEDAIRLEEQNAQLRDEVTDLKQQISALQEMRLENEALRQLLDFQDSASSDLNTVTARIIGRDPVNQSILLLNVGQRDGLEIGNAVIVNDGIVVAKIIDVSTTASRAVLLNDSSSSLAVTISGRSPSSKIARGERGLSLILDQIPQGEIVNRGEIVITSGLEPVIPKGLIIGEIEETISETNDLFQSAILRPLVDYSSIDLVAIVLSP